MFGVSASFLTLTFLTVQTFLVIKFPFHSRNWLTMRKIITTCTLIWIFSFLLGLGSISWLRYQGDIILKIYISETGILHLAVFVQIILNIQVTITIRKSRRIPGNATVTKQRTMAKTVIILTVIYFLTAFPYFILTQLYFLARLGIFGQDATRVKLFAICYFYAPFSKINSVVNPVLHSLRLTDYRKSLLACVGKRNRGFPRKRTWSIRTSAWLISMTTLRRSQRHTNGN